MNGQANRVVPASHPPPRSTDEPLLRVLVDALAYADARGYHGTDYGDGLRGTVRRAVTAVVPALPWPFGTATGTTRPAHPVDERHRDFEGTARYLAASVLCHDLRSDIGFGATDGATGGATDAETAPDRERARQLADWLLAHRSDGYHGFCGGRPAAPHGYAAVRPPPGAPRTTTRQDGGSGEGALRAAASQPGDRRLADAPSGTHRVPDVVSTATAVDALLAVGDDDVTAVAMTAARFVTADLSYRTTPAGTIVDAVPGADLRAPTHTNRPSGVAEGRPPRPYRPAVVALAAAAELFVALYGTTGRDDYRDRATRLLDTVADARDPAGGWDAPARGLPYAASVGAGRTLQAYARYARDCSSDRYRSVLRDGVDWYRSTFFGTTARARGGRGVGAARTLSTAAQGVVTFTLAGELPFAERVLLSAHRRFYAGDGRFYAGDGRFPTRRVTPVGRCHAPMTHALATYLDAVRDRAQPRSAVR